MLSGGVFWQSVAEKSYSVLFLTAYVNICPMACVQGISDDEVAEEDAAVRDEPQQVPGHPVPHQVPREAPRQNHRLQVRPKQRIYSLREGKPTPLVIN